MALDQTANFVRGSTSESVTNSQTTIGVNDANTYPDPTNGNYNLVLWDADNHPRPDQDPDVEIVRVTGRDTTNNTITVSRGQESTTAVSHPSGSALHLSPTSGFFADVASKSQLGVTHVQTSEPAYSEGDTWVDPNTGIYRAAYDAGGGGDYHPVPPIRVLEEASTFSENDVSITHNKTGVNNGSIKLEGTSSTISPALGSTYTNRTEAGFVTNPNSDLAEFTIQQFGPNLANVEEVRVEEVSSGTIIDSTTSTSTPITFTGTFSVGTDYAIYIYDSGGNVEYDRLGNEYPLTSSTFDITDGWEDGASSSLAGGAIAELQGTKTAPSSGDALITWSSGVPADIESWDLATFQRTLDNETVDVYVAESSDGGSTWSRVNGGNPITRNFDISTIAPSNDVRIEVEISRSVLTNNPTLDYAARRYVR